MLIGQVDSAALESLLSSAGESQSDNAMSLAAFKAQTAGARQAAQLAASNAYESELAAAEAAWTVDMATADAGYLSEYYADQTGDLSGELADYRAYLEAMENAQRELESEQCRLAGLLQDSVDTETPFLGVSAFAVSSATSTSAAQSCGNEWHHLLPNEHKDKFFLAGITDEMRNSAKYGWVLDQEAHRGKGGLHPNWNKEWKAYFDKLDELEREPTKQGVTLKLEAMKKKYLTTKKGGQIGQQATVSYSEWTKIQKEMRETAEELTKKAKKAPGTKFSKTLKFGGRAIKIIVVATAVNDVASEGVVVAAENAGRDLIWPLPQITGKAQDKINGLVDHGIDHRHNMETYGEPPVDGPLTPKANYQ